MFKQILHDINPLFNFDWCSKGKTVVYLSKLCVLIHLFFFLGMPLVQADVQYVYDETDRLVEVLDTSGNSALYQYDAADNLKTIRRFVAGDLAIAEFTPNSGPVGTLVTIYGIGFSATAASNIVKFNGVPSAVNSATANKLVVVVPVGATSGFLTVTVGAKTTTSTEPFTVTIESVNAPPIITNFAPTIGAFGTPVAINGNYFDAIASNNTVKFNKSSPVAIINNTKTQINTTVPTGIASGHISVRTAYGIAISTGDFYVLPTGYTAAQIGSTKRISTNSLPNPINTGAVGKIAMVLFDGVQGQSLGIGLSPVTFTPSGSGTLRILTPEGTDLMPSQYFSAADSFDLPTLPSSGTYTILLIPSTTSSLNATLTLSTDIAGSLTSNGAAATFITARVGQNARYTFNGTLGQHLSLLMTGDTFPGYTYAYILKPDGTQLDYGYTYYDSGAATSGTFEITNLPATGTYTVFVTPQGGATGTVSVALRGDIGGATTVNNVAATAVTLGAGQNGKYTFTGVVGQKLGLGITNLLTTPSGGYAYIYVYKPDGSLLTDCSYYYEGSGSCDLDPLPTAGTYSIYVDPNGLSAVSLNLLLSADLTGTLATNGAAATFTTARVGQNARYTFNGTLGQHLSLLMTGDTFPGYTYAYILKPDGTQLDYGYTYYGSGAATSGIFDITNLPATGTYTVFVTPQGGATGTVSVALRGDIGGATTVNNAASTTVTLGAGQNGKYTFTGAVGQKLGLGVTNLLTTPSGGYAYIYVYKPDGSLLTNCSYYYEGSGSCDLDPLPAAGTYSIYVDPNGLSAVSLNLLLSADLTGTLATNGAAATFTTARVGQNARYTFNGTLGQHLSLLMTGDTFPGYTYAYILKPDGTQLDYGYTYYGSGAATSGIFDITNLPATGNYTVFVTPQGGATGTVSVALRGDIGGATTVNNVASTAISLGAGQNGKYTFTGAVGQKLGLGVTNLLATTSGGYAYIRVYKPDGTELTACGYFYEGADSCDLDPLPAAGTYSIYVDPNGLSAVSLNLLLSADLTGTLATNGAASTFTTARVGQNARYTFNGTLGQHLSLLMTGDTFPGYTYAYILKPDGTQLDYGYTYYGSGAATSGIFDITNLPATGTYTVFVTPQGGATGTVSVALRGDIGGATTVNNAASTAITLGAGQNGKYTFTGAVGQKLGLGFTNLLTTPSGGYAYIYVYKPDGSLLTNCSYYYEGSGSCDLDPLPAAGTYSIYVDPNGLSAVSLNLLLSADLTGTLATNGAAATFITARVGQNARYTFNGIAAQILTLNLSGDTYPGYTYVYFLKPDGTQLTYTYLYSSDTTTGTSGSFTLPSLPVTGAYSAFVTPQGAATGRIQLKLQ